MDVRRIVTAVGLCGLLPLLIASCQNATQPVDLRSERTMTLELRSTRNEPIAGATVDWQKITGASAPIGARVTTAADGYARWVVPDVSTARDSVRFVVMIPSTAPTGAAGPITVATSVCNDTLIELAVAPPVPCGTVNGRDTILLESCPGTGSSTTTQCIVLPSTCPDNLVFTAQDSSSGSISATLRSVNTGSSAVEICASFAPPASASPGFREEFAMRVEGRSTGSGAVLVAFDVIVIGSVTCEPCPCPSFQRVTYTSLPICTGSTEEVVIPLSTLVAPVTSGPDCVVEFTLVSPTDAELRITDGASFTVRSGQTMPPITVEITPTGTGQFRRTLEWSVLTRNRTTGVTEQCPSRLTLDLTTNVLSPACVINARTLDSLQKCVFADTSTTDTFSIANTGDCPLTVQISSTSSLFTASPSGSVTLAPRSTRTVTVSFAATKTDWDAHPMTPIAPRGDKYFSGVISVTGCGPEVRVNVPGTAYIQCDAFKYQCLRQFRPPGFPNVYAESIQLIEDKTNILYQNDNQTFRQYDIFVKSLTPNGTGYDLELGSGGNGNTTFGVFRRIASGFSVNPGQSICDTYPQNAPTECSTMKSDLTQGSASLGGLQAGDVVLYTKIGANGLQCALIWVQSIGPDRPGPNALPQACIEICYPVFAL